MLTNNKQGNAGINTSTKNITEISLKPHSGIKHRAIAVASSTGGPTALRTYFETLPKNLRCPIFVTQHIPAGYTDNLVIAIERCSGLPCFEAKTGMHVLPDQVYVAPGGIHMLVETKGSIPTITLSDAAPENHCKPSAEPMLRSIADIYGKKTLVVFLTGMGKDGLVGAKMISEMGGTIIAQDEETSAVWGMPGAVARAGICSSVLPLEQLGPETAKLVILS